MRHDVLIVGAGPAGSTAAQLLAKAGWSVALVEKSAFPRRKVCGEFVSATTMPVLKALGVDSNFMANCGPPVTQVGVYAGNVMLHGRQEDILGRALGREHLDMMLRDQAQASGAELFQPCSALDLDRRSDGFVCSLPDGRQIKAPIVIGACGSWNAKGVFAIPMAEPKAGDFFAFKAHFAHGRLPAGLMPLLAFPGGYGGLVQSDCGRTSLSCCIRRDVLVQIRSHYGGKAGDAVLRHILATTKGARLALGDATLEGAILSTGPIRPGLRSCHDDGIFFVGNLAGEAHPVIAEGISMAIQSSALLAELLMSDRSERYAIAWKRRFASRIRTASVFAQLATHSATRATCMALLQTAPNLLAIGARLCGKVPVCT